MDPIVYITWKQPTNLVRLDLWKSLQELALAHCSLTLEDLKLLAEELPYTSLRCHRVFFNEKKGEEARSNGDFPGVTSQQFQ